MSDSSPTQPPVVVLTGPTATGKSTLALQLAERFGGEVVNADSMQVYRFLDIGTAKPSLEDRSRVPHHVFDVVTPDVPYSAGRYLEDARAAAAAIHARGAPVLLVGGTGLYIRAFLHGLVEEGGAADPELRAELEASHARAVAEDDPTRLHRRLDEEDPDSARTIHPNDVRRIIRALEILDRTGEAPSRVRARQGFDDSPYRVLHLALDLEVKELDARIDERCRNMIDGGLLQEVRGLVERRYGPELRSLQAIGYRHMWPVVEGSTTLARALPEMQRDTRRFARRQRTWLRRVPEAVWIDARDAESAAKRVESFLEETG
jgi:tRNA dimethylallyltransferase